MLTELPALNAQSHRVYAGCVLAALALRDFALPDIQMGSLTMKGVGSTAMGQHVQVL